MNITAKPKNKKQEMAALQGMQISNWKSTHYTLQVSCLSLTDRLINFKNMGTYCAKKLGSLRKCSWRACKITHTGKFPRFQNLLMQCAECLIRQSINALGYLKVNITLFLKHTYYAHIRIL